jgi:hypothetical protein
MRFAGQASGSNIIATFWAADYRNDLFCFGPGEVPKKALVTRYLALLRENLGPRDVEALAATWPRVADVTPRTSYHFVVSIRMSQYPWFLISDSVPVPLLKESQSTCGWVTGASLSNSGQFVRDL